MRSLGWVLIQYNWHPYEERMFGHRVVQRQKTGRRLPSMTWERGLGHIPPQPIEGTSPADTSGLDFSASRAGRTHFCCLRPSGGLVTEAHGGMWHAPRNALRASLPVLGGAASLQNPGVLVRSYKAGLVLPDHQAKAFALISLPLVAP